MIYVAVCNGTGPMILRLGVGSRVPIALTSMGRAYVSCLPDREREVALRRLREADPDGRDVTRGALEEARRQYRSLGFCLAVGAWHRGISSAGVGVDMDGGSPIQHEERVGGDGGGSKCSSRWGALT